MKLKHLLEQLFKTPYRQKRAMVLWRMSYQKHLLAKAIKWEKWNIKGKSSIDKT